jgi:secondary thiamine-phosphate synthase enzyme
MERIELSTKESTELIDITREVQALVSRKRVESGICVISTRHTTTGLIINENEAGLKSDIVKLLEGLAPRGKGYLHDRIDDNAHAHLRALLLGTWQSIFFVECDGPRRREVAVTVLKE